MTRKTNTMHGFTLVELLVAVVVTGILVGAVYQVLVNQSRVYVVEEHDIAMHQNARAALDFMSRELRLAGFGVADDDDIDTNVFVKLVNNAGGATEDADPGTDVIVFTAAVGTGSLVAEPADLDATTLLVYPASEKSFEFSKGDDANPHKLDLIIFQKGEKLKINEEPVAIAGVDYPAASAVPRLTKITLAKPLSEVVVDSVKETKSGLERGDQVALCSDTIRYRVRENVLERSVSNDGGATWAGTQALINDVEDLQLSYTYDGTDEDGKADADLPKDAGDGLPAVVYALDDENAGVLDTRLLADGKTDSLDPVAYRSNTEKAAAEASIGDPSYNPIRGVKVSLLVRARRQNPDHRFRALFEPPAVQDHDPAAETKDGFRRRLFEREISFRNLGLNPPPVMAVGDGDDEDDDSETDTDTTG